MWRCGDYRHRRDHRVSERSLRVCSRGVLAHFQVRPPREVSHSVPASGAPRGQQFRFILRTCRPGARPGGGSPCDADATLWCVRERPCGVRFTLPRCMPALHVGTQHWVPRKQGSDKASDEWYGATRWTPSATSCGFYCAIVDDPSRPRIFELFQEWRLPPTRTLRWHPGTSDDSE